MLAYAGTPTGTVVTALGFEMLSGTSTGASRLGLTPGSLARHGGLDPHADGAGGLLGSAIGAGESAVVHGVVRVTARQLACRNVGQQGLGFVDHDTGVDGVVVEVEHHGLAGFDTVIDRYYDRGFAGFDMGLVDATGVVGGNVRRSQGGHDGGVAVEQLEQCARRIFHDGSPWGGECPLPDDVLCVKRPDSDDLLLRAELK